LFLARYIDRGPVANTCIEIQDDVVTYRTEKDTQTHEFSALEFLARLTPHIAEKWESTVRYFGYYSHRARGARNKQQAALGEANAGHAGCDILPGQPACPGLSPGEQKKKASRTWAALIKRVFELEPLLCQRCGSAMKIKAFITDAAEVKRLLESLKIPPFTKPVPSCGAAPPKDTVFEPDVSYL